MFTLLGYKRQTEFWRDMWLMLLEPMSRIQPIHSSLDQAPPTKAEAQQPDPQVPDSDNRD